MRKGLRVLVIGNAAQDRAAKCQQIDELDALFNMRVGQGGNQIEAVDLCVQISERNRAVGDHNHDAAACGGLGAARYGKAVDDQAMGPAMPSSMRGP